MNGHHFGLSVRASPSIPAPSQTAQLPSLTQSRMPEVTEPFRSPAARSAEAGFIPKTKGLLQ